MATIEPGGDGSLEPRLREIVASAAGPVVWALTTGIDLARNFGVSNLPFITVARTGAQMELRLWLEGERSLWIQADVHGWVTFDECRADGGQDLVVELVRSFVNGGVRPWSGWFRRRKGLVLRIADSDFFLHLST